MSKAMLSCSRTLIPDGAAERIEARMKTQGVNETIT